MAVITYPVGQLFDDSGALLTAPVVTVTAVTDKVGSAITSPGASVNGSGSATPISVDYDAEAHGEGWITLGVTQSGHTITGANAAPVVYCARDSSRIISDLDAAVSSRSTYAGADTAGTSTLLTRISGSIAPQSGDAFARLGAPSGASVSADIAAANTALSLTLALIGQNQGVRNQQYDGNGNLLSADICAYDNATHAALNDGATGLAHKWSLALTYSGTVQQAQSLAQVS